MGPEGSGSSGGGANGSGAGLPSSHPLVGTWVGYAENHAFESGSETITIVIADPTPAGEIHFGDEPEPPPPTDPDVGYPPGVAHEGTGTLPIPAEGFRYALRAGQLDGQRVRFSMAPHELWSDWCPLQTPHPFGDSYACLPNAGTSFGGDECSLSYEDGTEEVVDCGKLLLCLQSNVCLCDAQACEAPLEAHVTFDLQLDGTRLDGSAEGLQGVHNVHFEKQ